MAKHNIVVVGTGGMSGAWIDYVVKYGGEDAKIVGLADINIDNARRQIENFKLDCNAYTDQAQAIAENNANLVFDVTVPKAHPQVVMGALKAGCNVFGEKPMAEDLDSAKEMVACADEMGKVYSVMQNYRYNPSAVAFAKLVNGGTIGQCGFLGADFFMAPRFGGFRDAMDSPLLLDMCIHTFDMARFVLDAAPVSVYCQEFNPAGSWYAGDANTIAIFEMSNGAVFCYRGSWCSEGFETGWNAHWRAQGSKGTAIWDGDEQIMPEYEIIDAEGNRVRDRAIDEYKGKDGHHACLDDMFKALDAGVPAPTDCHDNIHSISMVLKALESAKTGKKIYF